MFEDKRPDPKPRKNGRLWQFYTLYDELVEQRKRHILRSSSADRGKTFCFDPEVETWFLEKINLEEVLADVEDKMIQAGRDVGEIWEWLVALKGISESLAARLLAYIDYVGPMPERPDNFATISKLWRFAGLAVIDGKAERGTEHYNRRLKSLLLGDTLIVDQFVRQRTIVYRDIYDGEKERLRRVYPDPRCNKCDAVAVQKSKSWVCPDGCKPKKGEGFAIRHTPLHIDKMARRKVAKTFLAHLWLLWRQYEGLPISEPYILRKGTGHEHYVEPPGGRSPREPREPIDK